MLLALVHLLFLTSQTSFSDTFSAARSDPSSEQISDIVAKVGNSQYHPGEPLRIDAELINATVVQNVEIAYRSFGQTTYKVSQMSLVGNMASVVVPPADLIQPFLEYYLVLTKTNGTPPETYPELNPAEHPLKIDLQQAGEGKESSIIILSPEKNDNITPEDLYISYSLLRADSTINPASIKTYIDGIDISGNAVRSGNLVVVRPSMILESGKHTVRVEVFDTQGNSAENISWDFSSSTPGITTPSAGVPSWKYHYSAQAETRNENIQEVVTPYNRLRLSGTAEYGQYHLLGNLYVTNEEKEDRQPQNRYYIGGEASWLKLGYGDQYPIFPEFILNGIRVRGLGANLSLGGFNLDVANGDIVRHVESDTIKTFPADSLLAEQQKDPTGAYGVYDATTTPVRWAKFSYGTYDRKLFAIRPSFGNRDGGHVGFSYLKSSDDINSIQHGIRPKENLVVGSDLLMPFDSRRVELTAQVAMSATNTDITGGTFSDEKIDSLYKDESESQRDDIKKQRDALQRFITVNENLIPLKMANTPTLAYEGALALNYFNNNFVLTYLRHGNNFESFGQSFVRTDIAGYNLNDHLRLANGEVLVTAGFERLTDNTAQTKPATTTFLTGNASVGYFPKSDLPNVTVAYLLASSQNGIPADSIFSADDQTNRIFVQLGKEYMLGPKHNTTLGVSASNRDDHTVQNLDTKNTTVTLSDVGTFTFPLQTVLSLNYVSNSFVTAAGSASSHDTTIGYTTLYVQAMYRTLREQLRFTGAVSPTFGDIERTMIDARAQYYFVPNVSLLGQLSFYLNKNLANDIIWSFILRADM